MNGWFLSLIILWTLVLGIDLAKHGKQKQDKHNFWGSLIGVILSFILTYMAIKSGF